MGQSTWGQIKNIKLHIVTDIKYDTPNHSLVQWASHVVFELLVNFELFDANNVGMISDTRKLIWEQLLKPILLVELPMPKELYWKKLELRRNSQIQPFVNVFESNSSRTVKRSQLLYPMTVV